MENETELIEIKEKAKSWTGNKFDEQTRKQVMNLLENNETELIDSFYRNLEFGTGGLRGIMGVGTNRMNIYTVGMATQGLCNYLQKEFGSLAQIKVAIAHDSRNNSRLFAESTANIFTANGFKVYLFEDLRPTPELSFAIRHFGCQSGVVITASHNPKEYNGYKVYWEDGGQIISPHDKNIINEVSKIQDIDEVKTNGNNEFIEIIGSELDEIYVSKIKELSLSPDIIEKHNDLKIVYTPIHGTGVKLVPKALHKLGFRNICNVPEQDVPDGNFPTVKSPNPEESAALDMALKKAEEVGADLVMATDPDSDRVGIAVRNNENELVLLNGNQISALLINYLLTKWAYNNKLTGKEYIVKTIVTTDLLIKIANKYVVEHYDVLTGFKYIADIIKKFEGKKTFIGGGEESYGYLVGEFVRDKDAIISCCFIAETAAWAKENGKSLFHQLLEISKEYGLYKEELISVVRKGKSGAEEIQEIMEKFRKNPPISLANSEITVIHDYLSQQTNNLQTGNTCAIKLPQSNVLQFITADGSKISVRPSGTEPKIKFYVSVNEPLPAIEKHNEISAKLANKIQVILSELGIH